MKFLICLPVLIAFAYGQSTNCIDNLLSCLKRQLDGNYPAFERELASGHSALGQRCFAFSTSDAIAKRVCKLDNPRVLSEHICGRNGPLAGCGACQSTCRKLVDSIHAYDERTSLCVRDSLKAAIAAEIEYCVKGRFPSFVLRRPIPDFDQQLVRNRDAVLNSITRGFNNEWAMALCEAWIEDKYGRNPSHPIWGRIPNTKRCLADRTPFPRHCQAAATCDAQAQPQCPQQYPVLKATSCLCMDNLRKNLHDRAERIAQVLLRRDLNALACQQMISRELNTGVVNWKSDVLDAVLSCSGRRGALNSADGILKLACTAAIQERRRNPNGRGVQSIVEKISKFASVLLDVLIGRVMRFCNENCPATRPF